MVKLANGLFTLLAIISEFDRCLGVEVLGM